MSFRLPINASRVNGAKSQGSAAPQAKLAAAANSAKSMGPTTPKGKAICLRNATRRGLLLDPLMLEGEGEDRSPTAQTQKLRNELNPTQDDYGLPIPLHPIDPIHPWPFIKFPNEPNLTQDNYGARIPLHPIDPIHPWPFYK